ncbi:hypothetical protein JQC67_08620 [Aurantibacter crassamenti]|uniref:hypothetical protein n=1 Tax=Aurantibacter crassamenti TaxID=1837375 RepID=UPI0019399F08|nr:hypothetical protein [Aurantibacter crassamenti]MBM1106197.1 hypothetical protein [Aurantibacter crassamenti]
MTKRTSLATLVFISAFGFSQTVVAQDAHNHDHTHHAHEHADLALNHEHENIQSDNYKGPAKLVTGQGEFIFSYDEALTAAFPKAAHEFEPKMHGGFNEDPETGIVYTGIPGYGLCSISSDLTQWNVIGTDARLKDNIHGIVFFVHKGTKYLAVAQNGKRVLVLTLDGTIVSEIVKPTGNEFKFAPANDFFGSKDSDFGVTDVTYLKGTIYVAHGYSAGDFVMTIKEKKGVWSWGKLAWGGKGDAPGQFKTAHGVYAHDNHVLVANRAAGQVVKFTKKGKFVETFNDIPAESLVCNVSYKSEHFFLNALSAIGEQKSAPIYVHTGEKLVSTVIPGNLDIPVLTNIHQVWPHFVEDSNGTKQLYLLVHGWNKGKFAVLRLE